MGTMAFDVASSFSSRRRLGSAVAEDQPEPDPAPELDVDGEKRVRDGSDQVLIGIDRLCHAGGLRIGPAWWPL